VTNAEEPRGRNATGLGAATSFRAPSTETERTLAQIWCQVLELSEVGVDDNFFALGGDSILSISVVAQAEERGLNISLVDVFKSQTVAKLATVADRAVPSTDQG
jgi:aryl carrier-like protein